MKKYEKLASDIIENVGGKDNVKELTHCITRLRFRLKDENKAKTEVMENMDGVASVVKAMGQYMVVIGEHVADVYDEVMEQLGFVQGEKQVETEKKSFFDKALAMISSAMGPTLNLLSASGILKGLSFLLVVAGLSQESGIYVLMNAAGDALFYAMPIFMGFNLAKYMGIDPYFGFLFGAALTYPAIQGVDISLFGQTINVTYTSTFFPIILGILVVTPIYKFFRARLPRVINGVLTPMLSLLIAFPIVFAVVGPVANLISTGLAYAFDFLFVKAPFFAPIILGGIWQILVMFGVHMIPSMFAFYALLSGTPSSLLASSGGASFGIVGMMIALILKTKDEKLKTASGPAAVSALMGVTEPAMYGIIASRKLLLAIACIGGAVGGLFVGAFGLKLYTYAGLGIIGLLGFINPENPQLLGIALMVIVPMIVGFVLTYMFYKDDEEKTSVSVKDAKDVTDVSVSSPVKGEVKALKESSDQAFSSEALGKGVVIIPENGEIVAPVSGTVKVLFPTKHAVGLETENGCEVLLHLGVNTVNLQGKYFDSFVKQGDHVEAGQKLISFDKDSIEKEGYSTEVLMVITNTNNYLDVVQMKDGKTVSGEEVLRLIPRKDV
ncbi:MAG: PTS glucose transporter subunit IIA [Erysipelotrichaceae bacterium]|nr:PTS glucose transporter subunit IIA [Erysipelotrichaceae bacterium]